MTTRSSTSPAPPHPPTLTDASLSPHSHAPSHSDLPHTPSSSHTPVFERNWPKAYSLCPKFSGPWSLTFSASHPWPDGFRRHDDFFFYETKLCVPSIFLSDLIRHHHILCGHLGAAKLWSEISRRYSVHNPTLAQNLCKTITRGCEICQASSHLNRSANVKMSPTPIPPPPWITLPLTCFQWTP